VPLETSGGRAITFKIMTLDMEPWHGRIWGKQSHAGQRDKARRMTYHRYHPLWNGLGETACDPCGVRRARPPSELGFHGTPGSGCDLRMIEVWRKLSVYVRTVILSGKSTVYSLG
jgi:hypothetical protein